MIDPGAFPGIGLADALPDARSAAGHGGDVSLKKAGHSFLPILRRKNGPPALGRESPIRSPGDAC